MNGLADELWTKTMGGAAKPADRTRKIGMVIDKLSANHVARENFFPEIRRQIPMLQDWVVKNNLLTLDREPSAGGARNAAVPARRGRRQHRRARPVPAAGPHLLQRHAARRHDGGRKPRAACANITTWILQILNIHEAIPGHYAQLVYANKSPSLVKSLFGNGAMVEGWAVYAERMMLESGYGDNAPEMWLMYCKWNLRSVTNTILDYSVHVQGMTQAQAMDLLVRQAFQTHGRGEREVAPRAAQFGAADQLLQRLQRDHGTARAAQAGARAEVRAEGFPRAVPQLRQRAGQGDQGADAVSIHSPRPAEPGRGC